MIKIMMIIIIIIMIIIIINRDLYSKDDHVQQKWS